MSDINLPRRRLLGTAAATAIASELAFLAPARANGPAMPRIQQIDAGVLNVGYVDAGPRDGPVVFLLHGFPYAIGSYWEVGRLLGDQGCRVIIPHLRGHGSTRFLDDKAARSGQQAALAQDLIALMDALGIDKAYFAGYDWGARTACAAAVLWPQRCLGIVSVNGYLVQDIASAGKPIAAEIEAGLWYQYYFATERGRAGLEKNRRDIARVIWRHNSPQWQFDEGIFERAMTVTDNPDYVDVVVHNYRFRLGLAAGVSAYETLEKRLAALPPVTVPAITLDGSADGVVPATDGKAQAAKFTGPRTHRIVPGAGHNLPLEAPEAFANAVRDLIHTTTH